MGIYSTSIKEMYVIVSVTLIFIIVVSIMDLPDLCRGCGVKRLSYNAKGFF